MIEYTVKVYANGSKCWYVAGKLHREDGPAIEYASGTKKWYVDGERHREDGPAVEYADGDKYWYIEGKKFTEAEFDKRRNPVSESCEGKMVEIDGKQYRLAAI